MDTMSVRRFFGITVGAMAAAFFLAAVISRVSAATFDSSIVPNSAGTLSLGTAAGDWSSINDTIFFSGHNIGIGDSILSPDAQLHVRGDMKIESGNLYFTNDSYGPVLEASNSGCWRVVVDDVGTLSTVSASCI